MKEIKYLNHIIRNFLLFFVGYLALHLIFSFTTSLQTFFLGLFTYVIGYSVVYFLNDFNDWEGDIKYKKANLYLTIKNKKLFWSIVVILLIVGVVFSYLISITSLILLMVMYILNIIYSFEPFRLRNKFYLGAIDIFTIYFIKWFLVLSYLHFLISINTLTLAIMVASLATLGGAVYKRHIKHNPLIEIISGVAFSISLTYTMKLYPKLLFLMIPVIPIGVYIILRYKKEQVPLGLYQTIYAIYAVILFIILRFINL